MKTQARELLILTGIFAAIPAALVYVAGGFPEPWDTYLAGLIIAGIIFAVLFVLCLIGLPETEPEDHIRLWQLGLALGLPLVFYADLVTGDSGDFAVMSRHWAFWPGLAGVGYAGGLGAWQVLKWIGKWLFNAEDEPQLTTHGSARFATDEEIKEAGLLSNAGVYIGHYPNLTNDGLWYNGDGHLITVASSGSGKGVSAVIPNLLTWEGSVLCNDPKGENAAITARHRQDMGQEVYVLNPWGLHTGEPWNLRCAAFNPLDWLDTTSEDVGDDAAMMANALVLRDKGTSGVEGHFADEAESLLTGLILYVAFTEHEPERRNLVTLRKLLTQAPEDWADTLKKMARAPYADGLIASAANRFLSKSDREGPAVLSTAQRHTNFLDSNRMRQVLSTSDFDLADLKRKPMTIYLCLPFEHVGGQFSRWLRLMITLSLTALSRHEGADKPRRAVPAR